MTVARNRQTSKKFSAQIELEKSARVEADSEEVGAKVAEKFKDFTLSPDPEREKELLSTVTAKHKSVPDENKRAVSASEDLPYYLKMMPEGSDKSKHIVAAAQAALILGTPASQISRQFGISEGRLSQWKDTLIVIGAVGRRDRLSDMLMAYIEQELKSLMSISIVTSNEEWVERQSADQLAQFVAVKSDRLLLLLQAFSRVDSSRQHYAEQLEVLERNA